MIVVLHLEYISKVLKAHCLTTQICSIFTNNQRLHKLLSAIGQDSTITISFKLNAEAQPIINDQPNLMFMNEF